MSKMNELATVLDDLVSAATQLKMCAQDLLTASNRLRGLYETEDAEEPQPPRKKTSPRKVPEPESETELQPESEPQAPPPEPEYTKEQIRGMLSDLAGNGHREEAKALVSRYANGGSFSDIDPARYPELAEEVQKINA